MYSSSCNFDVLVNGRPVREYHHQGKIYIEGRRGKEYELRFRNDSSTRKMIVVSVDGLNIMTGDSTWERGYVCNGNDTIVIPGWRKNSNQTAHFEFSDLRGSYNQHNDSGSANNVGVIGCRVFNEVQRPKVVHHHHYVKEYVPVNPWPPQKYWPPKKYWLSGHSDGPMYSSRSFGSAGYNTGTMSCNLAATEKSAPIMQMQNSIDNGVAMASADPGPLGTGWGEDTVFNTVSVEFERQPYPLTSFSLYYDIRDNLVRRGVNLGHYTYNAPDPNPFPDGCPPPR